MAGADEGCNQTAADKPGTTGNQDSFAPPNVGGERRSIPGHQIRCARCRHPVAKREQSHSDSGNQTEPRPYSMVGRDQTGRQSGPSQENWSREHQYGAIVQGKQRVIDPFAARQGPRHVLFDEIPERDTDFYPEQCYQNPRQHAVRLAPAERQKDHGIKQVSDSVQPQFPRLGRTPGQALGKFMVIECVEGAHGDLQRNQAPKQIVNHRKDPPCHEIGRSGE